MGLGIGFNAEGGAKTTEQVRTSALDLSIEEESF